MIKAKQVKIIKQIMGSKSVDIWARWKLPVVYIYVSFSWLPALCPNIQFVWTNNQGRDMVIWMKVAL